MALEPTVAKEITQYEYIFVGVDDAGDQSGASAQDLAKEIARRLEETFSARIHMGITEHRLYRDNTAYCFDIDLPAGSTPQVTEIGREVISATGTGAGLSVLTVAMEDDGLGADMATHADKRRITEIKETYKDIIRFGQRAKREQVNAEEARDLAFRFPELTLERVAPAIDMPEEGDQAGRALIGALAAVGLRVGGDDGMFLGTYDMTGFSARTFGAVAQCIGSFRYEYGIDPLFADRTGGGLGFHERINLIDKAKAVLNAGCFTLLCRLGGDDMWTPYSEEDFKKSAARRSSCDYFELDQEEEARFRETKRRSCSSCLYRKLTDKGFVCTAGHTPVR